jgi:hypothetical protein
MEIEKDNMGEKRAYQKTAYGDIDEG